MALKVKAKGQDAKDLLDMKGGFRNGPFKPQRDLAAMNGDGSRGGKMMDENPKSRQREGADKLEVSDITKAVKKTMVVPTPDATPVQGFETVEPVKRDLPADYPERARRANNAARDFRTALGRGKSSLPVVE